jgi:hypothetical protein
MDEVEIVEYDPNVRNGTQRFCRFGGSIDMAGTRENRLTPAHARGAPLPNCAWRRTNESEVIAWFCFVCPRRASPCRDWAVGFAENPAYAGFSP